LLNYIFCLFQAFAEVETDFIRRHRGELSSSWNVREDASNFNILTYNNSINNPLIEKNGWTEFLAFHSLPDDIAVLLRYRGGNLFELAHYEVISSLQTIPSFHSRSLVPFYTDFFDMELTDMKIDVPKLVSHSY
jgi:hypothetical protein